MSVNAYGPNHLSLEESVECMSSFNELVRQMNVSDSDLVRYVEEYLASFRSTVEKFSPQIADSLSMYAHAPFHTLVLRIGPNGVVIGCRWRPGVEPVWRGGRRWPQGGDWILSRRSLARPATVLGGFP